MKVDLDFNLKDLSGNEIKDAHAGKLVASALSQSNKGNSIKLFDWAMKLWNKEVLELDDTDFNVLKAFISESEYMTVLAKGQIVKFLDNGKEEN